MKIIFLPPADKELEDAIVYYNDQLEGLGKQFFQEVSIALKFIKKFPYAWHKIEKHTRRFLLQKFPYLILYIPEKDKIIITAIAHKHRHPDYYFNRKNDI